MPTELAKTYDPREAQERFLKFWDEHGFFHSEPQVKRSLLGKRKPFTIVIPPPNVTGALHLGHALNNTLQDVLIRWRRMQGYNALWVPGTDHAGIATQAVVERIILQQEKKTRHDLGREELVKRIWQWKDKYETRILGQLKQLGASCDWVRTRFTLDPMCARAVRQTFFDLFKAGLIYRGKRLVNWDPFLQTAVADDEIFHETVKGGFWTFKYAVKPQGESSSPGGPPVVARSPDRATEFIRFSTTRPETMLGDTAVAVHPDDERFRHLIGRMVTVPMVNRDIPIIADPILVDPSLGTGAVKVTPAHDFNDYQCGLRNKLAMINILNPDGTINENGGKYKGMDRYKARDEVTKEMEALGLFEGREDRDIELAHSDRSKTPIEPYLSDQWFVKMGDPPSPEASLRASGELGLAQMAIDAVNDGRVKFFPERYARTYLDWLAEKRDWCISRQLWWGHRIPVWYKRELPGPAAMTGWITCPTVQALPQEAWEYVTYSYDPAEYYGVRDKQEMTFLISVAPGHEEIEKMLEERGCVRDPDVLDTWFSSALWPHSTLGWPEQTPELKYYYPTSVLVTSRDIITLWVARMVMTGLFNCKQVPFPHVYIHPKILDGFGETMSKSKGNGIDPLDIIQRYGTDALRFVMTHMATETQDNRMPVSNVCPHCDTLVPVKHEHMNMRTRKVACPSCKKPFRPGGPWPADDPELTTAKQASERFEVGRNFANKIWNAARFILLNLDGYTPREIRLEELPLEDRWILSRLARAAAEVTANLEGYHFSDAARTIYDFVWSEFCDWYIEMAKGRLMFAPQGDSSSPAGSGHEEVHTLPDFGIQDADSYTQVQSVLVGVLDGIIRLVQPIMPFLAESLWQALGTAARMRGLPKPARRPTAWSLPPGPRTPLGGKTLGLRSESPACRNWSGPYARFAIAIRSIRRRSSKLTFVATRRFRPILPCLSRLSSRSPV